MRPRVLFFASVVAVTFASQALAFRCQFTAECYETDACAESEFELEVFADDNEISTVSGDLTIVAIKNAENLITIFATSEGAEYLMSVSAEVARFTAHVGNEPLAITYLGQCEGAF